MPLDKSEYVSNIFKEDIFSMQSFLSSYLAVPLSHSWLAGIRSLAGDTD